MSLHLKSDMAANNYIGDIHGVIGNTDWSLMLDFEQQQYIKSNLSIALSSILSNTRASTALVFDENNAPTQINTNNPRISYDAENKYKGLLVETRSLSYLGITNPTSGVVSVARPASDYPYYIFEIEGTGSVTASGSGIESQYGSGTKEDPLIFKVASGTGTVNINYTITGDVSYIGLGTFVNIASKRTKQYSIYGGRSQVDNNFVDLTSVITGNEWTVLLAVSMAKFYEKSFDLTGTTALSKGILKIYDEATNKNISFAARLTKDLYSQDLRIRLFDGTTEKAVNTMTALDKEYAVIAVTCSADGFYVSHNGVVSQLMSNMPAFKPSKILFGAVPDWTGNSNALDGVFTKMAVYNKKLSQQELAYVTKKSF
ncbi:hypothetical protein ABTK04_11985 [Acinetobacter baumannii]